MESFLAMVTVVATIVVVALIVGRVRSRHTSTRHQRSTAVRYMVFGCIVLLAPAMRVEGDNTYAWYLLRYGVFLSLIVTAFALVYMLIRRRYSFDEWMELTRADGLSLDRRLWKVIALLAFVLVIVYWGLKATIDMPI